jgi:hypothetical protein
VHLELFANGRVVLIPARIGCWTSDPTGVVRYRKGATLGDFFRFWRQRLSPRKLLSFAGPVSAFRNGRRVAGDPGAIALRNGDELVLEVGGYVPPHRFYLFPPDHESSPIARTSATMPAARATRAAAKRMVMTTPL